MHTTVSRRLTYLMAVLYGVLGAILFFAPVQSAASFAWKVSPFLTMTIGAWCLGNAWLAWSTASRWEWWRVKTALLYLWLFGLLQTGVLIVFRDKLLFAHPIAWLYFIALAVNVLAALWGIVEWLRVRPAREPEGDPPTAMMRVFVTAYVLFVAFLGVFGISRGLAGRGAGGFVFPEPMSAFSLSSFSVFYLALALSAIPLLWQRNRDTLFHHGFSSYGLIVIITLATFVYIDRFDFVGRPLGLLYIGAYLIVGLITTVYLLKYRNRTRQPFLGPAST